MRLGRDIYDDNCSVCHQAGGQGVAEMQPPLAGSPGVEGSPATTIRWVLYGSEAEPAAGKRGYQNVMPPFDHLNNEELAAVVTFIRQTFGNGASPVSSGEVAAERAKRPGS